MPQEHLDRLTAVDASFLDQEGPESHMHVGALVTLEGPPPPMDDFLDSLRGRLHLVPRYRQKLAFPPRRAPAGRCGSTTRTSTSSTTCATPRCRRRAATSSCATSSRGSSPSSSTAPSRCGSCGSSRASTTARWALISKTHHALIDGIAGVDLAHGAVRHRRRCPREVEHPDRAWQPHREPAGGRPRRRRRARRGAHRRSRSPSGARLGRCSPQRRSAAAREAAEGIGEVVWATLNPAPDDAAQRPDRPAPALRRRARAARGLQARSRTTFGGTVNDVVLDRGRAAACATWLQLARRAHRGPRAARARAGVAARGARARGQLGNQIAAMRGPLPVYIADPVERLRAVRDAMDGLKESKQALGAEVLAGRAELRAADDARRRVAAELLDAAVQPASSPTCPGPQFPLYVLGREMQTVFPIAFLPARARLAIAIISYNGCLNFGLLGDYDALPDIEERRRRHRGARSTSCVDARAQAREGRALREHAVEPAAEPSAARARGRRARRGAASRLPARSTATREERVPRARPARARRSRALARARRCAPARGRRPSATPRSGRRPLATTPARRRVGAAPAQRERAAARAHRRAQPRAPAARRSSGRAASTAARASTIPQPRSAVHPGRRAARGLLEQPHDLGARAGRGSGRGRARRRR